MMVWINKSLTGLFFFVSAFVTMHAGCEPSVSSIDTATSESPVFNSSPSESPVLESLPAESKSPAETATVAISAADRQDTAADEDLNDDEASANNRDASPATVTDTATQSPTVDQPLPSMKVRPRTRVRANGVLDLTFDDVEFAIDKDTDFDRSMLPAEVEAIDGKEVIIRGFILESYQLKNIKEFVLVRDNQECCFGPGAYIYHNMQVEMVGDARAEYSIRPITIQGKFTIKPWIGPDGKCYSVYHIAATSFKR